MKKYALMQAPIVKNEYSAQIVIVDNSTYTGKKKFESLCNDGYMHIGWIESDYRLHQLKAGFEYDCRKRIDSARGLLNQINALSDEWF